METEGQLMLRLLDGLDTSVWEETGIQPFFKLSDANNLALKAKMNLAWKRNAGKGSSEDRVEEFVESPFSEASWSAPKVCPSTTN